MGVVQMEKIPRSNADDYTDEMVQKRQAFLEDKTGKRVVHIKKYSFDPDILAGNIENFTGVAQVPIGIAGPILVNGEQIGRAHV